MAALYRTGKPSIVAGSNPDRSRNTARQLLDKVMVRCCSHGQEPECVNECDCRKGIWIFTSYLICVPFVVLVGHKDDSCGWAVDTCRVHSRSE